MQTFLALLIARLIALRNFINKKIALFGNPPLDSPQILQVFRLFSFFALI